MLTYFNRHYLFDTNLHGCVRSICCCCVDDPEPKYLFKGQKLYIKNEKVPEPEDINWDSFEVGCCGKFCRVLVSVLVILVFLALSCTIIGLCSIYISSNSIDCTNVTIPATVAEAEATITSDTDKKCFCNSNLFESFNSKAIQNYCGSLLNEIYTEQGIQYAIIGTSGFVNFLFGFIVDKLVNLTKPMSHSSGYVWKTSIYTIFMIFNTVFLPILLYANIFGFKASSYVSFISLISTDVKNFFKVETLTLN